MPVLGQDNGIDHCLSHISLQVRVKWPEAFFAPSRSILELDLRGVLWQVLEPLDVGIKL